MCRAQKKVCAAIAVGGSDWIDFTEPVMNLVLTNLSKDAIVIDRLVIGGYTAPAMVLLDDDLLSRAAQLGSNMVNALLNKQNAQYQGPKGVCPGCHCNVIVPQNGLDVTCAFCKSRGKISNQKRCSGHRLGQTVGRNSSFYEAGRGRSSG